MFRQLAAGVSGGARVIDRDSLKQTAAAVAAELVEGGMLVGLGTGSTASRAIRRLGERYRDGLRFTGVPTSVASAEIARLFGIPLLESPTATPIDLTIDGADEIGEVGLDLIKGMGGALLREKIVAVTSQRLVIIADETKLSSRLSGRVPIPVEIVAFGWESTRARLAALGCQTVLKRDDRGLPYQTDGGNFIVHCKFDALAEPRAVELALSGVVGVVETGLFLGLATTALVATQAGVRRIER
jgi:ribose 5-phosphate isomerase A